ncbi:MAG TPA: hypothetical protein VGD54_05995, partial [Steroidobacteraceae bacterium]
MTRTIATNKITIFLPTGELEIALNTSLSCRTKPKWTTFAFDAGPLFFVVGSVTVLSALSRD